MHAKVAALGDWLERTDANVGRIIEMPDKAQREISASVVALEVYDFKCMLNASEDWDSVRRKVNYQACSGPQAGRWTQDRDVDLYHWSSAKFESTWRDTISVLIARGRAQVGVHSAKSDWSRRILDFAYMDYDDQAAHHE